MNTPTFNSFGKRHRVSALFLAIVLLNVSLVLGARGSSGEPSQPDSNTSSVIMTAAPVSPVTVGGGDIGDTSDPNTGAGAPAGDPEAGGSAGSGAAELAPLPDYGVDVPEVIPVFPGDPAFVVIPVFPGDPAFEAIQNSNIGGGHGQLPDGSGVVNNPNEPLGGGTGTDADLSNRDIVYVLNGQIVPGGCEGCVESRWSTVRAQCPEAVIILADDTLGCEQYSNMQPAGVTDTDWIPAQ